MEKVYRYMVEMPGRESLRVDAPDKLSATKQAAVRWDVKWRETARDMTVFQLGRTPVKK